MATESKTTDIQKLDGCIVQIQSIKYDGYFIDPRQSKTARITGCGLSARQSAQWSKWIIRSVGSNKVSFESLIYPDHYIDMNPKKSHKGHVQKVTHSFTRPGPWGIFKLHGPLGCCAIQSTRWKDRWLDAHTSKELLGSQWKGGSSPPNIKWGLWNIQMPVIIRDRWVKRGIFHNTSNLTVNHKWDVMTGTKSTSGSSGEIGVELTMEVTQNLGCAAFASGSAKFGAKHHQKWASSSSKTMRTATAETMECLAEPGTTIWYTQLQADYGTFQVFSPEVKFHSAPI